MKKKSFLILVAICAVINLLAQNTEHKLTVDLQLRSRGELRDGALMPKVEDDDIAAFINNRTRLNLDYKKSFLEIGLSLQHVGVWGDDKQVHKDADLGVHEAWAKMTFGDGFFVKLGRQVISYDDQRILGALDWHVAGRHHDALQLGYENEKNKLQLTLSFNQNGENVHGSFYDSRKGQPYKTMQTLWYNVAASSTAKLSFLFMNLGMQDTEDVKYLQTAGSYMDFKLSNKLGAKLSGYYQFGKIPGGYKTSAYMFSGILDYKFSSTFKSKIGMDYLSGNKKDNEKITAFNPLYGTHHKFYGAMDYFYVSPFINGLKPGLWDSYVGISNAVNSKFSYGLTYHYFQFTGDVFHTNGKEADKGLGSEFDFDMKWKIHQDITLSSGLSFALLSDSIELIKGGDAGKLQSWAWISLNVSPRLFTK